MGDQRVRQEVSRDRQDGARARLGKAREAGTGVEVANPGEPAKSKTSSKESWEGQGAPRVPAGPTHPGRAGIGLTSSPRTSSSRQDLSGAEKAGEEPSGPFVLSEAPWSLGGKYSFEGGPSCRPRWALSGHLAPSRPFWVSGLLFLPGSVSRPDVWEPGSPLSLSSPCSHP